jgi:predicted  nucleic acid-binding Zn-ribbon protein
MDLGALHALQVVDTAIDQASHARSRLPEIIEHDAARAEVRMIETDIVRVADSLTRAQTELDRIEHEAADIDARRGRLEKQLKTIISPREAEALQHEMQQLAAERNQLDDRGIELLEGTSAADEELVSLGERLERSRATEAAMAERRDVAEAAADAALAELRDRRANLMTNIAATDFDAYERLRKALSGVAVSHIEHGMCSGCRMDISVAELDAIKRQPPDAAVECPNCTRLLLR